MWPFRPLAVARRPLIAPTRSGLRVGNQISGESKPVQLFLQRSGEFTMLRIRRLLLLVVAAGFILSSTSIWSQCGVERWSVKTGTDPDASKVNLNFPTGTTIASMRAFTAPNPIPANNRVSPAETTVWVINATLTEYKLESDSDYHLVLQDASGNTMIQKFRCLPASAPPARSCQA